MKHNEIKSDAVMNFVNILVGALGAGFVDTHTPTLADIHKFAVWHVKNSYGVERQTLVESFGEEVAEICTNGLKGNESV